MYNALLNNTDLMNLDENKKRNLNSNKRLKQKLG